MTAQSQPTVRVWEIEFVQRTLGCTCARSAEADWHTTNWPLGRSPSPTPVLDGLREIAQGIAPKMRERAHAALSRGGEG